MRRTRFKVRPREIIAPKNNSRFPNFTSFTSVRFVQNVIYIIKFKAKITIKLKIKNFNTYVHCERGKFHR